MNAEEYGQLKQKLIDVVPREAIAYNVPRSIILRTPSGFLRFNHMVLPPELQDVPQVTKDLLDNKLVIMWSANYPEPVWNNIGQEIAEGTKFFDKRTEAAVAWLNGLFKIREVLGYA